VLFLSSDSLSTSFPAVILKFVPIYFLMLEVPPCLIGTELFIMDEDIAEMEFRHETEVYLDEVIFE